MNFKKTLKRHSKNHLIKAKASLPKFNCDPSTASKSVNNEANNSTLNFVNIVNTMTTILMTT